MCVCFCDALKDVGVDAQMRVCVCVCARVCLGGGEGAVCMYVCVSVMH